MNLQIVSNTIGAINENKTNKFDMNLIQPIDALNNEGYIEVLSVCYPSTTKNVLTNTCFIDLELDFKYFKISLGHEADVKTLMAKGMSFDDILLQYRYEDVEVNFKKSRLNIPEGIYDLERLIQYINNVYNEYDVFFSIEKNGKVKINVNLFIEYWLLQKDPSYKLSSGQFAHDGKSLNEFRMAAMSFDKQKLFQYNVNITMSEKLTFMLGFKNAEQKFSLTNSSYTSKFAEYLPDVSDGLNKIFIYCEELERVLVGDTSAELLTTIPIQWGSQGNGNGSLICFSPPNTKKKFKKASIKTLHISLRDSAGDLIPFDSGTVTIDCLIHYA